MIDNTIQLGRRITGALSAKWHNWMARQELASCDAGEIKRMAQELGFTPGELILLAGSGPDAADLLYRRLNALGMDSETIKATVPEAMRDMQRCCSECVAKRRCAGDLDASDDSRWQGYCPNAETLALLKSLKLHQ
jgi:hypothetical protein